MCHETINFHSDEVSKAESIPATGGHTMDEAGS